MEKSGAYWPEANNDPSVMARLSKAAHTLAGLESVRVPFDIVVDASAFGSPTGKEGRRRQPVVLDSVITDRERLDRAKAPDPSKAGRSPIVLEAIRSLAHDSDLEHVPLVCGITGPFMLTCQLRGPEEAILDVILDPGFLKDILEKAAQWNAAFSVAALEAGADIIAINDGLSMGDILGPAEFMEFAQPYQKMISDAIHRQSGLSILHICGDTRMNMPQMIQTGANGISVDQQMDIGWVKRQVAGKAACIGNVHPIKTLFFKGPQDVIAETRTVIDAGTDVVAPGCGFLPGTPLANIVAMVNATLEHGKR